MLEDLPVDLPATFRRILRQLDESSAANSSLAKKIFHMVAAAQRPLTLDELCVALSIIPGDASWHPMQLVNDSKRALGCCGSLLVIDEEYSTIHFAHSCVRQYITSQPTEFNVQVYHVNMPDSRTRFVEILITYLNLDVFE